MVSSSALPQDKPEVSVVMPVHNGAAYLGETIRAIYRQTYSNFEIVLIDDASTDDINSVIEDNRDPRLVVVRLENNLGVAGARNVGVSRARGKFIAFCDADDLCQPSRLDKQVNFLKNNQLIGVCGTAFTCFDDSDLETIKNPGANHEIRHALIKGNCFGMSTIMGNARLFRDNPFDQSMAPTEDYDLWARLAAAGVHLSNLSESLVRYRIHPMQASQQKSLRLDQLARKIRSIYCARLIGATALASRMDSETLDLADLLESAKAIAEFCAADPEFSTLEFRFMMAWIYQKLQSHNIRHWWTWLRIQDKLGWRLDSNYRLNVALLAVLPRWATRSFFDTLVKLKR